MHNLQHLRTVPRNDSLLRQFAQMFKAAYTFEPAQGGKKACWRQNDDTEA